MLEDKNQRMIEQAIKSENKTILCTHILYGSPVLEKHTSYFLFSVYIASANRCLLFSIKQFQVLNGLSV